MRLAEHVFIGHPGGEAKYAFTSQELVERFLREPLPKSLASDNLRIAGADDYGYVYGDDVIVRDFWKNQRDRELSIVRARAPEILKCKYYIGVTVQSLTGGELYTDAEQQDVSALGYLHSQFCKFSAPLCCSSGGVKLR